MAEPHVYAVLKDAKLLRKAQEVVEAELGDEIKLCSKEWEDKEETARARVAYMAHLITCRKFLGDLIDHPPK